MESGDTSETQDGSDPAAAEADADPSAMTPTDSSPDDGDDVASRNPDAIAHEIEQTRAELADTIDAIAERINPKRAAARSAQAVKAQVSSAREKVSGSDALGSGSANGSGPLQPASSAPLPVVPIAALAGLLVVFVLFLRRRRSR